MSVARYQDKAYEIIKESIKSAIFIDEKARTPFQKEETLTGAAEEKISLDLYTNFREAGISLSIHKYKLRDEKDTNLKEYLFEDRDLVLLDWNLQETSGGEEHALELLVDIIKRPYIHFCTIYTSESASGLDNVFRNILSYFSNNTIDDYKDIQEELESDYNITKIKSQLDYINLNRHSDDCGKKVGELFKTNSSEIKEIKKITKKTDNKCAIIQASIALSNTIKSSEPHPCPSISSFANKTLIIENTIITILNKSENSPSNLIKNISKQIVKNHSSFTQLLGLEMQTIFSKSSAFIDQNLLNCTKHSLIYHRENYKKESLEHFFPEFIKEIMLEKAKLNIRCKQFTLLEDSFLDGQNEKKVPNDKELIAMNIFYNSSKLQGTNQLNFGDVFKKEDKEEYFICITALCDCLRPDKIGNAFFFAKGVPIRTKDALPLGDTAFISYLSDKQIVKWTDVNTYIALEHHKFSPVYIKPLQFTVPSTNFTKDNNLEFKSLDSKGTPKSFEVKYITTIKSNYTQRIANHAFNHPIRVGVDFVKKAK